MAQEEKKDGKQVVLPYDEYQEMVQKIAENSSPIDFVKVTK